MQRCGTGKSQNQYCVRAEVGARGDGKQKPSTSISLEYNAISLCKAKYISAASGADAFTLDATTKSKDNTNTREKGIVLQILLGR